MSDYNITTGEIGRDFVCTLDRAQQYAVAVNLLLSPHYFPDWALERWPDLASKAAGHLRFRIDHPMARRMIEDYLRTLVSLIKDHPALHSVTLTYEPVYRTHKDDRYLPAWRRYLEACYEGQIERLNEAHGASYAGFADVPMYDGNGRTTAAYDWVVFNNGIFAEWHRWMAEIIRESAPELPIHVKIMVEHLGCLGWGIDIEAFSKLSRINGNDNWNYLGEGGRGFSKEMFFYDLQSSMNRAPVFNSEHHIIPDGDQRYTPDHARHVQAMLWQGPLHGKSASTIWVWERTYDMADDKEGSVLHRPDVVAAVGRTNHDLNRLAWEVTAFQNSEAGVALLYSVPSAVCSKDYGTVLADAYEAVFFSGEKVAFVTEDQLANSRADRYRLLIVPAASHVFPTTLEVLLDYAERGGLVIIIGDDALKLEPRGSRLSPERHAELFARSVFLPGDGQSSLQLRTQLMPIFASAGLCTVILTDVTTGQPVCEAGWRIAEAGGSTLLSIINYSTLEKRVVIRRDGSLCRALTDRISGRSVNESELLLESLTPYLFELESPRENSLGE